MRSITVALVLSAALVALLALGQLNASPLWVAPLTVFIGVAAACTAAGGVTWLAVVFGALGTLALGWLTPWNPSVALIVTCVSWLVPRGFLTRSKRDLVVFAAAAIPGAILAGLIASHFALAPFAQHLAACVFAGAALAVSNVVVRVDTPVAHGLLTAGRTLEGEVAQALLDAADTSRMTEQTPPDNRVPATTWRELLKDADARVSLRGAKGEDAEKKRAELDKSILDRVAALRPAKAAEAKVETPAKTDELEDLPSAQTLPKTVVDSDEPGVVQASPQVDSEPGENAEPKTVHASPAVEALVP
jgi:hypothetical protein